MLIMRAEDRKKMGFVSNKAEEQQVVRVKSTLNSIASKFRFLNRNTILKSANVICFDACIGSHAQTRQCVAEYAYRRIMTDTS